MLESVKVWIADKDFVSLYKTMHEDDTISDNDKVELLPYILELATEIVHENIINQKKVDFDQEGEHFMLRFLYDSAMAAYETGEFYEAKEALALLSAVSNSKHFEKSMQKHIFALTQDMDFNTFVTRWVEPVDLKHFYISAFTTELEKKFKDKSTVVDMAVSQYKKLFK